MNAITPKLFGKPGEIVVAPSGPDSYMIGLAPGRLITTPGPAGPAGARGLDGRAGSVGQIGPPGVPGADGADGVAGVLTFEAGEVIGSPRAVMLVNGQLFLFDPGDEDSVFRLVGVSANAAIIGDPVSVIASGLIQSPGSFVQGAAYFASALGVLTTTVPSSGVRAKIGVAETTGRLIVDMTEPLILI